MNIINHRNYPNREIIMGKSWGKHYEAELLVVTIQ